MTNTIDLVFTHVTYNVMDVIDAYLGIGMALLLALLAYGIACLFVPRKNRVI
jgi:hypothetical protein